MAEFVPEYMPPPERKKLATSPEMRMWLALLEDAVKVVRGDVSTNRWLVSDTVKWFREDARDSGAFLTVCDRLGLSPDAVRRALGDAIAEVRVCPPKTRKRSKYSPDNPPPPSSLNALIRRGLTISQLATRFSAPDEWVLGWLAKMEANSHARAYARAQEVARMRQAGLTKKQIAAELHVGMHTINRDLLRLVGRAA